MRAAARLLFGMVVFSGCAGEAEGPVELRFAVDPGPTVYRSSYEQSIQWGPATTVTRAYGTRIAVLGGADGSGSTVRLDSLRAHVATPHGQQTFDSRHLVGSEFTLLVNERGGAPSYRDEPVLEAPGIIEQRVALSRILDYGFPHLPDGAVQVGDTWTSSATRSQVEVQLTMTADVVTDYLFAGWDSVDGVALARIEGLVTGSMSGSAEQERGPTLGYAGTLEGRLTWLFDPVTGALVSLSGEEVSTGVLTAAEAETPIEQTTTIEIRGTREGV